MPKPPLRIAILECDTPLDKTKAIYGGYGGVFKQMLERGADELDHSDLSSDTGLKLSMYDVVSQDIYPQLHDIDAILITGSRHNAFDDVPWINTLVDFTRTVLNQDRVRLIGVCFGHQIIGRAMGQRVGRSDKDWEVSVVPIELSPLGKELFKVDKLSIWQMHRDIVDGIPEGAEQLARTDICENQGMYIKNRVITVQGHPEFTRDIEDEIIRNRYKLGLFTDELYKDALLRLKDRDDGITVAQAFLRFLMEG